MYTAKRSIFQRDYFIIYLNGRAWRVCHQTKIEARLAELNASKSGR